jgi:hypothetical protein
MVTTFAVSGLSVALANPTVGKATATQTVLVSDQRLAEVEGGTLENCILGIGILAAGIASGQPMVIALGLYTIATEC